MYGHNDFTATLCTVENIYSSHPLITQTYIRMTFYHRRGMSYIFAGFLHAHVDVGRGELTDKEAMATAHRPTHA